MLKQRGRLSLHGNSKVRALLKQRGLFVRYVFSYTDNDELMRCYDRSQLDEKYLSDMCERATGQAHKIYHRQWEIERQYQEQVKSELIKRGLFQ